MVREIEHHDIANAGIVADHFQDPHPPEWMKQALMTYQEARQSYIVR
jgi:hypothetical protein